MKSALTLTFFALMLPTAAADAPSELDIIKGYLAPFDTAVVQGEHCRRWGGLNGVLGGVGVSFPATNTLLQHHELWHEVHEGGRAIDDAYRDEANSYGTMFRDFHRHMLHDYDAWRVANDYEKVGVWDPSTPVPAKYMYPSDVPRGLFPTGDDPGTAIVTVYCLPRDSDDPKVALPTWATVVGGTEPDPVFGHLALCEFTGVNQLAKSIDDPETSFHGLVHRSLAGDLRPSYTSPRDPLFWPWHNFLEVEVFQAWETACKAEPAVARTAESQPAVPGVEGLSSLAILVACVIFLRRFCAR